MNYTEMMQSEKAFQSFLIKQTRRTEFKIRYYFLLTRTLNDFSFIDTKLVISACMEFTIVIQTVHSTLEPSIKKALQPLHPFSVKT